MTRTKKRIAKATIGLLGYLTLFVAQPLYAFINNTVTELNSSYNWSGNFTSIIGLPPTSHFGAYVFHEYDNELYIGLGRGRPAELDGALVLKYDGTSVKTVGRLDEQGINEIVSTSDKVIIGGVDPAYPDDWSMSNVYTYSGNTLTKHRNGNGLTHVIHLWGLEVAGDGTLYAAASTHDGTYPSTCDAAGNYGVHCFGEIYKSTNGGANWTKLARLGDYRVFDIKLFSGKLYALYVNSLEDDAKLASSSDGGTTWTPIALPAADGRRTHMIEFHNQLLMLGGGALNNKIYAISTDNAVTQYELSFSVGLDYSTQTYTLSADKTIIQSDTSSFYCNYNQFVVASDDYLYTITRTGDVVRTIDLVNWDTVADTSLGLISLGYWKSQNKLVFSERGNAAKIWTIDLDDNAQVSITNVRASINVIDVSTNLSAKTASSHLTGTGRTIRLQSLAGAAFAQVTADLTESRNWSGVNGDALLADGKSFAHNVANVPGASSTYSLLILIPQNSEGREAVLCPSATALDDVKGDCLGAVRFKANETKAVSNRNVTVTKITIDGASYWKATGLAGTCGGIDASPRTDAINRSGEQPT